MTVEVLASTVVDGRRSRIRVASGDLDVAKRDSRIEGRHDERGSQHVGMNDPEPSPLADRTDPPVSSPAVEPLAVLPSEDGSLGALPDNQVDGPSRPRDQWDDCWLVALAEDPEGPVPAVEGDVLDARSARLADPQAVQSEEDGEGRMIPVEAFCCVEEGAELSSVEPRPSDGWTFGRRTYWAGLAATRPSMWAKR